MVLVTYLALVVGPAANAEVVGAPLVSVERRYWVADLVVARAAAVVDDRVVQAAEGCAETVHAEPIVGEGVVGDKRYGTRGHEQP